MFAYIDTSIWITRAEGWPAYRYVIEEHLNQIQREGWHFCASTVVKMELYYKLYRDNNQSLLMIYQELFQNTKMLPGYTMLLEDGLHLVKKETLKALFCTPTYWLYRLTTVCSGRCCAPPLMLVVSHTAKEIG